MRWAAIALLSPSFHGSPIRGAEQRVTAAVRFTARPSWFPDLLEADLVRESLGEHVDDDHAFCLLAEYEATSLTTPHVLDADELDAHDGAKAEIQSAVTMLWLSRRTSFGFDKIILAEEAPGSWEFRQLTTHDERAPLSSYVSADMEPEDFGHAAGFALALGAASSGGTVKTAINTLGLALTQRTWPLRLLTLWLALEGLFGPSDSRETTYRLCQRITLFLEPRGPLAVSRFDDVNKLYRWRSKTVHGMRLQSLKPSESEDIIERTEALLHRALRKLLSDDALVRLFDSKDRETFLDRLALT